MKNLITDLTNAMEVMQYITVGKIDKRTMIARILALYTMDCDCGDNFKAIERELLEKITVFHIQGKPFNVLHNVLYNYKALDIADFKELCDMYSGQGINFMVVGVPHRIH